MPGRPATGQAGAVARSGERPAFVDTLAHAYQQKKRSVVLLTGNTRDLFASPRTTGYVRLEQLLYRELCDKFVVVRVDFANGIGFYDDADATELQRVCSLADAMVNDPRRRLGDVNALVAQNRHAPLPTLVCLREIAAAFHRAALVQEQRTRPLCVILQSAGAFFPIGDFDRLSELDRQRLVTFLSWIEDPVFSRAPNLLLLLADTRSEVNGRILAQPATQHIEVPLPDAAARGAFVDRFLATGPVAFAMGDAGDFIADTAGLRLCNIEDLLEVARGTGEPVTRKVVLAEVNAALEAELGDVVRVKLPEHGPADVIGNKATAEILADVFRRCEDPSSAVSAVLVSGPNGGGKTFQMEAFARESGRIVIELTGLRGMYFGQTDKFFEMLRWHLRTYGKILILVDEAHTAFGSVHRSDTHETEKRLAGNIIKMMGDPTMRVKVLWGLMTSRPDELDPDVKSRMPLQIPIFDPEGDDRVAFIRELFARKGLPLTDTELAEVVKLTGHYSARDLDNLVREVRAMKRPVPEVLQRWRASDAITSQRRLQTLIAAQHCTYPDLLPAGLRDLSAEQIAAEVEALQLRLHV